MRFEAAQHLRTAQQLKLSPRLIQSMEILALPSAALEERILQELERNVALEAGPPEAEAERERPDRERALGEDDGSARGFERLREMERNYGEFLDNDDGPWRSTRHDGERDAKMAAMANTPSRAETLVDRLQHEWRLAEVPEDLRAPGLAIIEHLNDDGLLGAPLETILAEPRAADARWDLATLTRALAAVQGALDPPGLAARDVRESLLLQIDAILSGRDLDRGRGHGLAAWQDARVLVEREWENLLENRLPRIEARAGIPMARINAAREALRRLRLAPGRDVRDESPSPIMPDAVVEYDADQDRYVAALADGGLPVLRVSPTYQRMASDTGVDAQTRTFVGQSVRSAQWLIEAVHQRRSTLLRVLEEVIRRQRPWFDEGPEALRPLEMTEIADALGVHVATVSRAVSGKWIQTPRGIVELRRFFSGGTETAEGEGASWDAVRQMVREVVEAEDKARPLSDEAIAGRLKERGVQIARRTVMKYREQLGIPTARHRKVHGGGA
jgi:RNA polymerase sigma-54 factor